MTPAAFNGGMSAPIKTTVPAILRKGDTATWLITLPEYPASAGWSLRYDLINAAQKLYFTSSAQGSDHLINVAPVTTGAWTAGKYQYQCRASNGTDAFTVDTGAIEILDDFATAAASDRRGHAAKVLEKIEAWLETGDITVARYRISVAGTDREIQSIAIPELLKLRDLYRKEVRQSASNPKSGRIYMRF